jgi:serine protease Do
MILLVKSIYDFFFSNITRDIKRTLSDFLNTIPEYRIKGDDGIDIIDMVVANNISSICKQMANDMLLIPLKPYSSFCLYDIYSSVPESNFVDYPAFLMDLEYGAYDFKYQGFVYTRNWFERSIVPIVGINANGDEDMGSAYYIGDNMFVTAAHCVNGLKTMNLLLDDRCPIGLKEVWFANDVDPHLYDVAIIVTDDEVDVPTLRFDEAVVLDPVVVMGYPPIPGMFPIQTTETATVGALIPHQKSAIGEVVSPSKNYISNLDYFVINARVKGGNSGGPVINSWGKVIGTVVETSFDSHGGALSGRYDIMGYGLCLPSKYVSQLINDHYVKEMRCADNSYYIID